jgi:hypothetical protein
VVAKARSEPSKGGIKASKGSKPRVSVRSAQLRERARHSHARDLASCGCTVERLQYVYDRPAESSSPARTSKPSTTASGEFRGCLGGARLRGAVLPTSPTMTSAASTNR